MNESCSARSTMVGQVIADQVAHESRPAATTRTMTSGSNRGHQPVGVRVQAGSPGAVAGAATEEVDRIGLTAERTRPARQSGPYLFGALGGRPGGAGVDDDESGNQLGMPGCDADRDDPAH